MAEAGGLESAAVGELLSTSVKRLLLGRLMRGFYKPGERIIERQASKEFGISQSPVREALRVGHRNRHNALAARLPGPDAHKRRACQH